MKCSTITLMLFCLSLFYVCNASSCFARNNVSRYIEFLDNPYLGYYPQKRKAYARNIWDMIGFKGKIYLGAGNSCNNGPSPNAGPVPIFSYVPETNSFEPVAMTSEEQINAFYSYNNRLIVPGHDPKESWDLGNIYLSEDGVRWQKKRTIPNAIHTFCLCMFNDKLFAGIATIDGAAIAISADLGNSWTLSHVEKSRRIHEFIVANNRLFAVGIFAERKRIIKAGDDNTDITIQEIFEYDDLTSFNFRKDLTRTTIFPDTVFSRDEPCKIRGTVQVLNKSIYLGCYAHNNLQFIPFGVYIAESSPDESLSFRKVSLPENVQPWDIYHAGDFTYILLNKTINFKRTEVSVLRSSDLKNWKELFYFISPSLIRSFAILQNSFYFSVGSEISDPNNWHQYELKPETGEIIRLNARYALQD